MQRQTVGEIIIFGVSDFHGLNYHFIAQLIPDEICVLIDLMTATSFSCNWKHK